MAALTVSHVIGTAVMCAGACTAPMIALLFPRAGPERAVSLAMRNSPLLRKLMPAAWQEDVHSQRTADVKKLQQLLNSGLVVVTGQRGVGKSRLIAAALADTPGVVPYPLLLTEVQAEAERREKRRGRHDGHGADRPLSSPPDVNAGDIVTCALRSVAGIESYLVDPAPSAQRVIAWHKRMYGVPPTLVVKIYNDQVEPGCDAAVTAAAAACGSELSHPSDSADRVPSSYLRNALRQLVQEYGLRVVVDSNDTDVQAAGLGGSGAYQLLEVGAMDRSDLEAIGDPQLQGLLADLREARMDDLVWRVLGGHPEAYMALSHRWRHAVAKDEAEAKTKANAKATAAAAAAAEGEASDSDSQAQAEADSHKERVRRTTRVAEAFLNGELSRAGAIARVRARQYAAASAVRSGAVKIGGEATRNGWSGRAKSRQQLSAEQFAAILAEEGARVRPALQLFQSHSPAGSGAGAAAAGVAASASGSDWDSDSEEGTASVPAQHFYGSGIPLDGGLLARRTVKVCVPAPAAAACRGIPALAADAAPCRDASGGPEHELTEETETPKAHAAGAPAGDACRYEEVHVATPATHAIGIVLRHGELYPDTRKLLHGIRARAGHLDAASAAAAAQTIATAAAAAGEARVGSAVVLR